MYKDRFYVCIGNGRPIECISYHIPNVGSRFEINGHVVEVMDIAHGKNGPRFK